MAGAQTDPLAALVFCTPPRVVYSIINGRVVVEGGELLAGELPTLIENHNRLAAELIG